MKRCPYCKTDKFLEVVDSNFVDAKGDGVGYDEPVYKCFKCNCEWNLEDLDDNEALCDGGNENSQSISH